MPHVNRPGPTWHSPETFLFDV
ncbi:hypothetical protein CCACVL1_22687, partial [Corchorus capsularis]